VDGALEASVLPFNGVEGDISYPDDGVPGNFCGGPCTGSDPFIVIGAEKHDAGSAYPAFFGWVDEVRLSDVVRYSGNFAPPSQAFVADADTAALYHFDEGSGNFIGDSAFNSLSPGERRFGGSPAGPIWDADTPFSGGGGNPGTIRYSSSTYAVGEGAGSQTITVTRSGGSDGSVTIDYATADGTAVSGSDYQPASGTLSWADGDATSKSFSISIVNDSDVEADETVNLSLSNITGGASLGNPQVAVLTIVDDDAATPGTVQFSAPEYSVGEGGGSVSITVNRSGGANGAVTVDYSFVDGTATAGSDYQPANGTLSWSDGDVSEKTIVVSILDDAIDESNETATISLNNPTGGLVIGDPPEATLTISDDDTRSQNPAGGGGSNGVFFLIFLFLTGRLTKHSQSSLVRRGWRHQDTQASESRL
jgi:hypothetical protein